MTEKLILEDIGVVKMCHVTVQVKILQWENLWHIHAAVIERVQAFKSECCKEKGFEDLIVIIKSNFFLFFFFSLLRSAHMSQVNNNIPATGE